LVAEYLSDPPCNYHRQEAFREMFAETEADLKTLIGIREPAAYFATLLTSTGTGANEACLQAFEGLGKGAILRNGFFGARAADQAAQNGIDHVVVDFPDDRPIDADALAAALDREGDLRWVFYVSHETRVGLSNPMVQIGRVCKDRGLMVAADIISSAYAYPIDIEQSQLDLAVASSAKALMAAPGIGIIFTRRDAVPALREARRGRGYYLDLVAEFDKQSAEMQPRFAQPVALHAAVRAACTHLATVGMDNHMSRIGAQLEEIRLHLEGLDVPALLDPSYRSGIAVNFRLPAGLPYADFAAKMTAQGYYLLYGIPGDDTHFQVSTIGDLHAEHISGLNDALTHVLAR
jgi:aspartate aminotransferase-like enzyme